MLSPKLALGHSRSITKNILPRIFIRVFFNEEISTRTIQASHEIANTMKHDRVAGLQKTVSLSREYKPRAAVALNRLLRGWYFKLSKVLRYVPYPIYLGTLLAIENKPKKNLYKLIPLELIFSTWRPDYTYVFTYNYKSRVLINQDTINLKKKQTCLPNSIF